MNNTFQAAVVNSHKVSADASLW